MIKLQEILELSVDERILMIGEIWDSIDHEQVQITGFQELELDRRLERYAKGETKFFTWSDIKDELNNTQ